MLRSSRKYTLVRKWKLRVPIYLLGKLEGALGRVLEREPE